MKSVAPTENTSDRNAYHTMQLDPGLHRFYGITSSKTCVMNIAQRRMTTSVLGVVSDRTKMRPETAALSPRFYVGSPLHTPGHPEVETIGLTTAGGSSPGDPPDRTVAVQKMSGKRMVDSRAHIYFPTSYSQPNLDPFWNRPLMTVFEFRTASSIS